MRPFVMHILVLAFFIVLGIALFAMETLSPHNSGGLIKKFAFTKLYFLVFSVYSLVSTCIVLFVGFFHRIRKKSFTKTAVIMSHVIPIGLVLVFVRLGLHDLIQDAWKDWITKSRHNPQQVQIEKSKKKRHPIPAAPVRKHLKYKPSERPVELDKQKSE